MSDPAAGDTLTLAALRDVLAFHAEAGVDVAIDEAPHDRFADAATDSSARPGETTREPRPHSFPTAPPPRGRAADPPPVAAPPPPEAAAMAAREAARCATTLDELRALLERFDGCALKATASRLVFADGNPQARAMFVGEAPGREEDIEGLPFVGRSGQLLDRMLKAIGLDRTSVYIANVVPWRPPGNRTPTPQETAICLPFVRRQIELVDPDVLVTLGAPSTAALLGTTEGIMKARGRWMSYDTGKRTIRALPTLHPAYLLRQPLAKRQVWRDMLAIQAALDGLTPSP